MIACLLWFVLAVAVGACGSALLGTHMVVGLLLYASALGCYGLMLRRAVRP